VSPVTKFVLGLVAACIGVGGLVAGVAMAPHRQTNGDGALVMGASGGVEGDPAIGAQLFAMTCATCHGVDARGMPEQGVSLKGSAFIARNADPSLIRFLRAGRPASDARSITGRMMPARGGNRDLTDQDLADIVRYLRTFDAVTVASN